jgi:hypothetical protein
MLDGSDGKGKYEVRGTKYEREEVQRTKGEKTEGGEMKERLVGDFLWPGKGAEGTAGKAGNEKAGCRCRKSKKVSDPNGGSLSNNLRYFVFIEGFSARLTKPS